MAGEESTGKLLTINDANIAAFLRTKGFKVDAFTKGSKSSTVVAWSVHGSKSDISAAVKLFYSNELVGIVDFVESLKGIRWEMYTLKSISSQ